MSKTLVIATTNQHKYQEFQFFFRHSPFILKSLADFPALREPKETGNSYKANALLKAKFYFQALKQPVLADDSGLEIYSLNRFPGLRSARFAAGDFVSAANNLLAKMYSTPWSLRGACFVSALAYVTSHTEVTFQGQVLGRISFERLGDNGFGYDPIFYYSRFKATFGQVQAELKHSVSHRYRAISQFLTSFSSNDIK